MLLSRLEIAGFKSFAKKTVFDFTHPVVSIVGPNGSGKSNVAESIRFVLGEQSMKSMRGKRGEDLIWNGSNALARANRASVAITFDNSARFLPVDFEEVVVERVVHRDGNNEYRLNGSVVRLRDIQELLAAANIGQSGHHIISQGEADKILAATAPVRREMLEDALGLKVYQYKLDESARKLEKTEANMVQVEGLRREIAPHIKFLKRQVEKLEKAEELRGVVLERYKTYFKLEREYIDSAQHQLKLKHEAATKDLRAAEEAIAHARATIARGADDGRAEEILQVSRALERAREERRLAAQKVSRIDGQIEALSRIVLRASVPADEIRTLAAESEQTFNSLAQSASSDILAYAYTLVARIRALVESARTSDIDVDELRAQRAEAEQAAEAATQQEAELSAQIERTRAELEGAREEERKYERALFELTSKEREAHHELALIVREQDSISSLAQELEREMAEVAPLVGTDVLHFNSVLTEPRERSVQESEKRELLKLKVRLEEVGVAGGADILKEYKEASEREAFLEKEVADLTASKAELVELTQNLKAELSVRFDNGLSAINTEFSKLFALMFDGGTAALERTNVTDELDAEAPAAMGIDISIMIPRKRIRALTMLSGGERALTSIALIFAMSSVNPPPFLVLDETDAALDEANSRRYGDMVRLLSDKSQLVVITHNRETMSRAGVLYGVTMGADGVSKVLSVKLEEAVKVAK